MLLSHSTQSPEFRYAVEVQFRTAQSELNLGNSEQAAARLDRLLAANPGHYLTTAASHFAGDAHFAAGNYVAAAKAYGQALKATEDNPYYEAALYGMGWSLFRASQFESATQAFGLFLQQFPKSESVPEISFLKAESQMRTGNLDQALDSYLSVPRGEYYDDALSGAGFAAAEKQDYATAAQFFEKLIQEVSDSPLAFEAMLHSGINRYRLEQYAQAVQSLERLVQSNAEDWLTEGYYWLGLSEKELNGPEPAVELFNRGLQTANSEDLRNRLILARSNALFDAGRFEEAEAGYAEVGAGSEDAIYSAAVAALNGTRYDQAIARARSLLQQFPNGSQAGNAYLVLGEAHFAKQDYEPALQAFQGLLSQDATEDATSRARAMSRSGWCLFYLQRFAEAAQSFGDLVKQFPQDDRAPEASFLRGRCLLRIPDYEQAELAFARHLQDYPGSEFEDDTLYDLAQAKRALGHVEEAERLLAKVAGGGSGSPLIARAKYDRAELLSAAGSYEQAVQLLREVVNSNPPPDLLHPALYSLAWAAHELEQWQDSAKALQQLTQSTNDPQLLIPALELMAAVERRGGNADGATRAYQKLIEIAPDSDRCSEVALVAALAQKEAGNPNNARSVLEDADQRWPNFSGRDRILLELGMLYKSDDPERYLALMTELSKNYPQSSLAADASFEIGEALFSDGQFEDALQAYRGSLQEGARLRDLALYKTAWCLLRLEQFEDASTRFASLHRDFPDSVVAGESLFLAGESLVRAEKFGPASEILQTFLNLYQKHESRANALFRLGICSGELEQWGDCLNTLSQLERLQPDFEHRLEADLWIGRSLLAQQRFDEARRRFQKVIDQDKGVLSARAYLGTGQISSAQQDYETALGEFLKVALLYENEDEVCESLWLAGNCLERMDDAERAAARYRELIERYPEHPLSKAARERLAQIQAM